MDYILWGRRLEKQNHPAVAIALCEFPLENMEGGDHDCIPVGGGEGKINKIAQKFTEKSCAEQSDGF